MDGSYEFGEKRLEDQDRDKRLAEFTDKLLSGEVSIVSSTRDSELRDLENTVVLLKKVLLDEQLSPEMAGRIRQNLAAAWSATHPQVKSVPVSRNNWLANLQKRVDLRALFAGRRTAPQNFAWSFATVVVIILAAILWLNPDMGGQPGTVLGPGNWLPAILLLIAVGLGLILFFRSRR